MLDLLYQCDLHQVCPEKESKTNHTIQSTKGHWKRIVIFLRIKIKECSGMVWTFCLAICVKLVSNYKVTITPLKLAVHWYRKNLLFFCFRMHLQSTFSGIYIILLALLSVWESTNLSIYSTLSWLTILSLSALNLPQKGMLQLMFTDHCYLETKPWLSEKILLWNATVFKNKRACRRSSYSQLIFFLSQCQPFSRLGYNKCTDSLVFLWLVSCRKHYWRISFIAVSDPSFCSI